MVPRDWAEEAVRLLPQGRLVVVPGAAHTVNFTHPTELAAVVLDVVGWP
jgi:2-hydroxy-6-oxonona-2,4-dienedioate hydrolase